MTMNEKSIVGVTIPKVTESVLIDPNTSVCMGTLQGEYGTWLFKHDSKTFISGRYFGDDAQKVVSDFINRI